MWKFGRKAKKESSVVEQKPVLRFNTNETTSSHLGLTVLAV